jgi:hypothetical protein
MPTKSSQALCEYAPRRSLQSDANDDRLDGRNIGGVIDVPCTNQSLKVFVSIHNNGMVGLVSFEYIAAAPSREILISHVCRSFDMISFTA